MRQPVLYIAVAILVAATGALLIFGGSGKVAGLPPSDFASAAYLSIFALLVGTSLAYGRYRINARLWHIAVWLAVFVALAAGYRWYHAVPDSIPTDGPSQSI